MPRVKVNMEEQEILGVKPALKPMRPAATEQQPAAVAEQPVVNRELIRCCGCARDLAKDKFYKSRNPRNVIGVTPWCKDCIEKIARNYRPDTREYNDCTQSSICTALELADLPFRTKTFEAARNEYEQTMTKVNSGDIPIASAPNLWSVYMARLGNKDSGRWKDSDIFANTNDKLEAQQHDDEVQAALKQNRRDVIRIVGYDPFAAEAEADLPFLYSNLLGYLDMEGDNNPTRLLDSIEIVRGYLQLSKLNDVSARAFATISMTGDTSPLKSTVDAKKAVTGVITDLAEQSCIALKHDKNVSKGDGTFTAKLAKLKNIDLRAKEINSFDIATVEGMRQVAEVSNRTLLEQLRLDESDYTQMLADQRELIDRLTTERNEAVEEARILLRENLDLKAVMSRGDTE